jgi:WS/DGAT/MGAT family acyltransferase
VQQLTAQDASFLYAETAKAPMSGGGLTIYDPSTAPGGKVTFKGLMTHIEQRLHMAQAFRQRIVTVPFNADHPYWIEDETFDIEFHMRHIALPEPGDWRQLCIQCARLISRPLDRTKPLWEFYVIDGLDRVKAYPPGCFAVLSKIHHAAVDGASGTELTSAIHDLEPIGGPPTPPPTEWRGERLPSAQQLLARAAFSNVAHPFRSLPPLAKAVAANRKIMELSRRQGAAELGPGAAPRTRFNAPVSAHRVVDGIMLDLDDVRSIRSLSPGSTVNDVFLALVGGALREYLQDKGELPAESLTAMCPISVRAEGDKSTSGNQVAAMMVALRTDIDDAAARLRAVHSGTKAAKELTNAIGAETMTEMGKVIPAAIAALAGRLSAAMAIANERTSPPYNTVVTNVPGPQVPLYMAGARAVAMYGFGMVHDNMGLMNVVNSYCGKIALSIASCRDMMPDPAFYAGCLQHSFDRLRAAAV